MKTPASTVLIVARHEMAESARSRRALVLAALYLAGAVAATLLFVKFLHEAETQVATSLGLDSARRAGGVSTVLWKSRPVRDTLTHLAGDPELARLLLGIPPLALFFGWLAFTFAPLLVVLTAAPRIAEDVWSGAVRFVLFRGTRFGWVLGKYLGLAMQLLAAMLVAACGVWVIGWLRLDAFEPDATALWIGVFAVKAWVYSLAYLGLALAMSQMCAGPNSATSLAFLAMVAAATLSWAWHLAGPGWRRIWEVAPLLAPGGHKLDLWRDDPAHVVPAVLFLVSLSLAYLAAGYARFARRDL
jgi:ABC-type transport system involved in multi-copper enzyme maturation permease subunit